MLTACQEHALTAMHAWFATTRPGAPSFFSLRGYAGTGKTYLSAQFLKELRADGVRGRIVVVAPTNKAVDVLRSKCRGVPDLDFRTLDSFLGFRVKRNDDWEMERSRGTTSKDSKPIALVLCDEASMVKAEYDQELQRSRVPVLYVGDPAQLQPIDEELSPALRHDGAIMTTITRQEEGNPIIELATYLRDCVNTGETFVLSDVRRYARQGDPRITFTALRNVYDWAEGALNKGLDCRILAFTNAAVNEANAIMHQRLYPDAPLFGVGERVLVNEAFDYDSDTLLTNGEVLTVRACREIEPTAGVVTFEVVATRDQGLELGEGEKRELTLKVALDPMHAIQVHRDLTTRIYAARKAGNIDEFEELSDKRRPLNKLAPLRHIYASTVHKSQGSTYDVALVDFGDIYRSREMRARLMYVAATRPSRFLVMLHRG